MKAKKSFGQHFLIDPSVAQRMVAAADFSDCKTVVEVGPGTGALTQEIVTELPSGCVLALVEADRELIDDLRTGFPSAEIVQADAVKVNFDEIASFSPLPEGGRKGGGRNEWILLSNLPYNAGNAIIMNALRSNNPPSQMIVMVQKEVADRMLAEPGEMSLLSVSVQLYAEVKRLFNVKPGAFSPPPKVQSSVLVLTPRVFEGVEDPESIIALAKAGFSSKRKQLHRNFASAGLANSGEVKKMLQSIQKLPTVRAQELSLRDWVALANMV